MGRLKYKELVKTRFKEQRNLVISEAYDKTNSFIGYSIAEQFVGEENGKKLEIFLNGSLGIVGRNGLAKMKLALDKACEKEKISEEELKAIMFEETKEEESF